MKHSLFNRNTPILITYSSLSTLLECQKKYYWRYIMGLERDYGDTKLTVGSMFHDLVAGKLTNIEMYKNHLSPANYIKTEIMAEVFVGFLAIQDNPSTRTTGATRTSIHELVFKYPMVLKLPDKVIYLNLMGKVDYVDISQGVLYEFKTSVDVKVEFGRVTGKILDDVMLDPQTDIYTLGLSSVTELNTVKYFYIKKCGYSITKKETPELFRERVLEYYSDTDKTIGTIELIPRRDYSWIIEYIKEVVSYLLDCYRNQRWLNNYKACKNSLYACQYRPLCLQPEDEEIKKMYITINPFGELE